MIKKIGFCVLLAIVFVPNVKAQTILMRLAQSYMDKQEYEAAIEVYQKVLEKDDELEAKINMAEAYRRIHDFKSAEHWYLQIAQETNIDPINYLHYAQTLQRNGKCAIAKRWFERYAETVPDDSRGQYLTRACDYQQQLLTKNKDLYQLQRVWFNSVMDDFSPIFYQGGLVFTSNAYEELFEKRVSTGDIQFLRLFYLQMASSDKDSALIATCNYVYGQPKIFDSQINSKYHDATATFSANEQEIFFTRSGIEPSTNKGTQTLQIFFAKKINDGWSEPLLLPFNGINYSVAHPTLSPKGDYLFFSSNMPGGYGGMDLYKVERVGTRWGQPLNLGRAVNTEGNELFPSCDNKGRLFFASDGHIGLGGLDILITEEQEDGRWGLPDNLGYPINSTDDDFGIIFNNEGTCGYFASNREGGKGGDDIYGFVKQAATLQISVYDSRTKQPLSAATVEDTCTSTAYSTNAMGKVTKDILLNTCCSFITTLENYEAETVEVCSDNLTPGASLNIDIFLKKQLQFTLTGIAFDEYTGLPVNEAKITLKSMCDNNTITDQTPPGGRYTFNLNENCCYEVSISHPNYTNAVVSHHCTKGLLNSETFLANAYLKPKKRG